MKGKQAAVAAEVRAEMARQNIKAARIQRDLNISSTAWGTYFVQCTRDVPMHKLVDVAEYLGLKPSDLLARAEASPAYYEPTDELEDGLSEPGRRAVDEGRAKHGVKRAKDAPQRVRRPRRSA